jgi:ssDNA-binding Zn-finger/Zn-ribbon topoisomerase 1
MIKEPLIYKEDIVCPVCADKNIEFSWFNLYDFSKNIMTCKCGNCKKTWEQKILIHEMVEK